jgi:aminoglycoside phosphotransferase family enzyme
MTGPSSRQQAKAGPVRSSTHEGGSAALTLPAHQHETAALLERLAGRPALETPISAVFVGADTVWKLRKAVTLGFLDFAPLAERERTARRELELNAPNAPGMYRDVVPVVRTATGLALAGEGEVVDWVVRMAPVPKQDFLDAVADQGGLSPALLDALGDTVAEMHQRMPPSDQDPVASLGRTLAGNLVSGLRAGLPAGRVQSWHENARAELDRLAPWLAERGRSGFVRRAHGDLHLRNMCLWQGKPVAFDALEFSEAMATIDLGYDLAFLLMDVEIHAGRAAANRVFNRYLARTGDLAMLPGLPLFLSMRALVRAHVTGSGGGDYARYLDYAEAALRPARCIVVAIGGLPGSGKSTLARGLAPGLGRAPGALILRSDEIRKRLFGLAPEQRLGKEAYGRDVSRRVMAEICQGAATAAKAGHAVVADATFMDIGARGDQGSCGGVAVSGNLAAGADEGVGSPRGRACRRCLRCRPGSAAPCRRRRSGTG